MIRVVAHNIISPLGKNSIENYNAVKQGVSSLKRYEGKYNIPEPFCASLFEEESDFQELAISSIDDATKALDFSGKHILLVISTVKGNISVSRIQQKGYCYHLSKLHIYALVYCIGVFLSGLLHFHPPH